MGAVPGVNVRQIAQVLHSVLNAKRFTSRDVLADALKSKCAQLRVPYDSTSVLAAIEMVAGGGRRRDIPPVDPPARPVETTRAAGAGFTAGVDPARLDAPSVLRQIMSMYRKRTGQSTKGLGPKKMPYAPPTPNTRGEAFAADKLKALQMVSTELLESIARDEALEATCPPLEGDDAT